MESGGENWTRVDVGPDDDRSGFWIMQRLPTAPPILITFGTSIDDTSRNLGFLRSTDMGKTWELFADELRNKSISNFAVSGDGQVIYVNESGTYFGWILTDGGETWSQCDIIQVNGPIAVSPVDSNLALFGSPGDLRRSTNGLDIFRVVMNTHTPIREIVFAPSDPNIVYAETDGYLLYRSDDAGLTWQLLVNIRDDVLNTQLE